MEKTDLSTAEWLNKAQAYCARAERCASQVKKKMLQWGADEQQIECVLSALQQEKYIDHQRFCEAFIHDKLLYQAWGKYKIIGMLRNLGLPENLISKAWDQVDDQQYRTILTKTAAKKKGSPEQVVRFLIQRGFALEEIRKCGIY